MPAMIGDAAVFDKAGRVQSTCTDEDQDEDSEDAGGALFRFHRIASAFCSTVSRI
jgi:hypothetical protein